MHKAPIVFFIIACVLLGLAAVNSNILKNIHSQYSTTTIASYTVNQLQSEPVVWPDQGPVFDLNYQQKISFVASQNAQALSMFNFVVQPNGLSPTEPWKANVTLLLPRVNATIYHLNGNLNETVELQIQGNFTSCGTPGIISYGSYGNSTYKLGVNGPYSVNDTTQILWILNFRTLAGKNQLFRFTLIQTNSTSNQCPINGALYLTATLIPKNYSAEIATTTRILTLNQTNQIHYIPKRYFHILVYGGIISISLCVLSLLLTDKRLSRRLLR
jgi:hypothetical protein